jgi:hypothetical protein
VVSEYENTTADASFDDLARSIADDGMTRRRAVALVGSSIFGGALASLGLAADADAKKKKKKKKKKKNNNNNVTPPPDPAPVGTVVTCPNFNTACGLGANTLICNCRLNKEGTQVCLNIVNPPNGAAFQPCQTSANCNGQLGEFCDFTGNVCRSSCRTA